MIYFTSDLHLGHRSVINMCQRPFDNIDEMNKTLIHNWNDIVTNNDTVYILGDLCYRIKNEEANSIIKKLKGKKILIVGNHDSKYGMYDETLFDEICYYKEMKYDHMKYILFHYPIEDWNGMYHGSIHLHGHSHNKPEYNLLMKEKGLRRYDVGVDANDFRPVSLDDILDFFPLNKYHDSFMFDKICVSNKYCRSGNPGCIKLEEEYYKNFYGFY